MPKYVERFRAMFKDMERYSFIELLEFSPQPPATASEIKSVESKLGVPLDATVRGFYEETNGLKLHWRIKRDLGIEESKKIRKKSSDYYVKIAEYIGDPFAFINIIPIQESIVVRDWKEISIDIEQKKIEIKGHSYSVKQLEKRVKPFDLLNEELCMAFLFLPDSGKPQVLLLSEGCVEWNNLRSTDFESYMEMLLTTRGIVEARMKIFGREEADPYSPLIGDAKFWQKKFTPNLFGK